MANMLYNGVELPALPETNQTYKYAIIVRAASAEKYYLRYCNYEVVFNNQLYCKGGGYDWNYNLENGEWVYTGESYRNSGNSMYGNIVVVWTNTDILTVDDGSVYFAGSEPVDPNAPTATYDRTAFLSGMAMGLTGKGYPTGANGHMSYNGIELADINSIWTDKSNHVFICKAVNSYFAIVSTVAPYQDSVNGGISLSAPFYFKQYGCFTDEAAANEYGTTAYTWKYFRDHSMDEGGSNFDQTVIWTSTDIRKDSDGSVFLAASEPFPAGGIGGNDDFTKGYLVGAELRRKRTLPKGEPVAYLYNGVRLPKLPEWDKETYPYAYIGERSGSAEYQGQIVLWFTKKQPTVSDSGLLFNLLQSNARYYLYKEDTNEWNGFEQSLSATMRVFWTNTDILGEDSTVHLAASAPVPIYE